MFHCHVSFRGVINLAITGRWLLGANFVEIHGNSYILNPDEIGSNSFSLLRKMWFQKLLGAFNCNPFNYRYDSVEKYEFIFLNVLRWKQKYEFFPKHPLRFLKGPFCQTFMLWVVCLGGPNVNGRKTYHRVHVHKNQVQGCSRANWVFPLTVYPWVLIILFSLGILGDNLPINTHEPKRA